jgi:hypothetical protein
VIVPFTIDQTYDVAPAGPDAVFPVERVQTAEDAGVIVGAAGFGLMGVVMLPEAEQPEAFVTTSVSCTLPEAPAV